MHTTQLDRSRINRILVIKPRAIGDVLLSTPVPANLRRAFPAARIDFMVENFAAPVLERNPNIDNIISYDSSSDSSLGVIWKVRRNRYDLVIDLFANPRTAVVTFFSAASYRVGYPFKWRKHAYNIIVEPRGALVHNVEFNLDAIRRIGIPADVSSPQFFIDEKSDSFASDFMRARSIDPDKFISLNLGGGWEIKRWKADKIIRLCTMIASDLRLPVVVLYGRSEENEARRICADSPAVLGPPTNLHEMGAIMRKSIALITNDSGPMHIAASLGVPTVAVFGPTSPSLQGPYGNKSVIVRNEGLDCLECNRTTCPIGNICMTQLEAETVFQKLLELLSSLGKGLRRTDESQ